MPADVLEARNMRLLGRETLGGFGNGGEGLAMHLARGRRMLFIAHESAPINFSVVDVTDPGAPRLVTQVRLPHERVRSNSLSAHGDLLIVAYQTKTVGDEPAGAELFDISDPANPRSIAFYSTAGPHSRGAHFVWLQDDRHAFLSTGLPDFQPRHPDDDQIVVILDVSDPSHPVESGRWWLPGTREGDAAPPPERHTVWDSGFRAHNVNVYPRRPDRAYVAYLDAGVVILDISDHARPAMVSRLDYHPPMPGFTHTVVPLFERGLLAVADESNVDAARDAPKNLWVAYAGDESHPLLVSSAPTPPAAEFAGRGGRFGMHNLHENDPVPTAWKSESTLIATFFNGGVRAFDIGNPFRPEEIGFLVPAAPPGSPMGAVQMNDVYVDDRRYIYAIDRFAGGLYVMELLD
jgi:hypothetical protein